MSCLSINPGFESKNYEFLTTHLKMLSKKACSSINDDYDGYVLCKAHLCPCLYRSQITNQPIDPWPLSLGGDHTYLGNYVITMTTQTVKITDFH